MWKVTSGPANASLSTEPVPWSGLPYLNVSYNLTNGYFAYVSPSSADAVSGVPDIIAISYSFYLPPGAPGTGADIAVTDGNGTGFGCNPWVYANGWNNFSIPLPNGTVQDKMWWPAGREMVQPLKSISFGVAKHVPNVGWFGLADVALVTSRAPGSIPDSVVMALLQPRPDVAGVLVAGGAVDPPAALGVVVTNRLRVPCSVSLALEMRNASGPMGLADWEPCGNAPSALAPWQSAELTCSVDPSTAPPGYVAVRGVISASNCWTVNDTESAVEAAVAIALPQPVVVPETRNVRAAVFGGQSEYHGSVSRRARAWSDPSRPSAVVPTFPAITRIGMWSIRSGPMWRWAQPAECWNVSSCFPGFAQFYDDDVFQASAAGVEVMLDARAVPAPPWAAARNDSGPTWASFPGPDHYDDYTRYLTVMLGRYGAMATTVEVDNEMDGLAYFQAAPRPPMDYVLVRASARARACARPCIASPFARRTCRSH